MPAELYDDLMGFCVLEDVNLAQQIRSCLSEMIAVKKSAPDFMARLEEATERQTALLKGLARDTAPRQSSPA